jgi:hypothetical protein
MYIYMYHFYFVNLDNVCVILRFRFQFLFWNWNWNWVPNGVFFSLVSFRFFVFFFFFFCELVSVFKISCFVILRAGSPFLLFRMDGSQVSEQNEPQLYRHLDWPHNAHSTRRQSGPTLIPHG